jgi:hypothetical protein
MLIIPKRGYMAILTPATMIKHSRAAGCCWLGFDIVVLLCIMMYHPMAWE